MTTILVANHERLLCDLLRAVFSRRGLEVRLATSGRDAIAHFREHRPLITVLDLRLADPEGIEVLQQIRAMDPQAAVITLTGDATDALENEARELGVSDCLSTGLSLDVLLDTVDRVAQHPHRPPSAESAPHERAVGTQPGASVLVVDDEPLIRDILKKFLTMRGYRVREARDGAEALALVDQERPQMIVLDMYLPGQNGIEVLHQLRAKAYEGGVVLLTASQDENLLQEGLNLGSVDVMSKPVDLERLVLTVEVGLALKAH